METMKSTTGSRSTSPAGTTAREGSEVVIVPGAARGKEPDALIMLAVNVETASNFYAGFTENLSECGVFVATHAPLPLGCTVDLSISLSGQDETIRARGTVRWLRPDSESSDVSPGMGVRFDQLSSTDSARIEAFCEVRAPMFFDDESLE
jgi:uncharacterized protein (TIGR02266 family)